ncbi:hypothetical protein [Melittangium boletus]|uniref:Lipoprotein n=1 Tax=Melittangium boletus DSM 14713 TaxID=1294270 RepID=A0A250IEU8_9BACT|nr:hypothetical protein [Melittangium boletus]ATB30285.1 hypothetical protein MEBOL_003745 [Melittangium boletus DSM 14713]
MLEPRAPLIPREALVQTKQKWALTLMTAWGAMSCGPAQPVDAYQGAMDGSALSANFRPPSICGEKKDTACTTYQAVTANANQETLSFYNLGFLASNASGLVKDTAQRLSLPVSLVKNNVYDVASECTAGKAFDVRTDAYREDVQYPVFDALPLGTTAVLPPLVAVKTWTDASAYTCNAIKSHQSLQDGVFGGAEAEGQTYALRAVINIALAVQPPANNPAYVPAYGWYRGLQLAYLDGGAARTEVVDVDNKGSVSQVPVFTAMDGVQVKAKQEDAAPTPANPGAVLVFAARPGTPEWSPVVRVRTFVVPAGKQPSDYTSLCYAAEDCPENSIDMKTLPVTNAAGLLFVVASNP